jgi:hypothetical protein
MSEKPAPRFTIEELLSQLKPKEGEEGFTTTELCEKAGLPPTHANLGKVRRHIHDLRATGQWETAPKKRVWNEGHQCWTHIPAARPIKKASKEKPGGGKE